MSRQLGPGSILGGYKLENEIGRGGMGVVYRAIQLNLGRPVAVKVLFFHEGDPGAAEYIERFFHEARAAAVLNHPNIVQIYDAGCCEGLYYYAMELVEGETVLALLRRSGGIGARRTLQIASDLVDALSYGWNNQHLVHGDIKPENVLIDAHGRTKLMDFGLSHFSNGGVGDDASLILTPHYAAPELVTAKVRGNCATDIYALGATLYQMLSGQTLFLGPDAQEIMRRQLLEEPIPLNVRAPAVPATIAEFIGRMLIKDPEKRINSWIAARNDLDQVLGKSGNIPDARPRIKVARPVAAPKTANAVPVAKPVKPKTAQRRSLALIITAILLLLGALAGVVAGGIWWLKTTTDQNKLPAWLRSGSEPAKTVPPSVEKPNPPAGQPPQPVFGQDPWKVPNAGAKPDGNPEPPKEAGNPEPPKEAGNPEPPKEAGNPEPPKEAGNPEPPKEAGNPPLPNGNDKWLFADTPESRRKDDLVRLLDQFQQADLFQRKQTTNHGQYPFGPSAGWDQEAIKSCQPAIEEYLRLYKNDPESAETIEARFLNKTVLEGGFFKLQGEVSNRIVAGTLPPPALGERVMMNAAESGWWPPFEMKVGWKDDTSVTVQCHRKRGRFGNDNRDIRIEWRKLPELSLLLLCDQVFAMPTAGTMSLFLLSPSVDDQTWERVWQRVPDKTPKKIWDQLRRDFRDAPRQRGALDLLAEASRCHQAGNDREAVAALKRFQEGGAAGVPTALRSGPRTDTHKRYYAKVAKLIRDLQEIPPRNPPPPVAAP
jgi:serine/threonine protein kinase